MVTQGVLTVRLVVVALHQAVFLVPTVAVSLVLQAVAVWVVMVVAYLLVVAVAVILAVVEVGAKMMDRGKVAAAGALLI